MMAMKLKTMILAPVVVIALMVVVAACSGGGGGGGDDDDDGATTGPTPTPTATSSSPQRLYTNRCGTGQGSIEVANVGSDGSLSVAGGPTSLPNVFYSFGGDAVSLAAHPATQRLYAATYGALFALDVNETTGALTALPGVPLGAENLGLMLTADGARAYAIAHFQTSSVIGFTSAGTALPGMPRKTVAKDGFSGALVRGGQFLFTSSLLSNTYEGFTVALDGSLTPLAGSPFALPVAGSGIYHIKADPAGEHLYFADYNHHTVIVISVSATGVPSNIPGSPFASVMFPNALAFNRDGSRLYVGSLGNRNLGAFDVASGALTPIAVTSTSGVNGSTNLGSALAVTEDDRFLYLVTTSGQIYGFSLGPTGAPTRLGPQPTLNLAVPSNPICSMAAYP